MSRVPAKPDCTEEPQNCAKEKKKTVPTRRELVDLERELRRVKCGYERAPGDCLYCGRPCRGVTCAHCRPLLRRDPHYAQPVEKFGD